MIRKPAHLDTQNPPGQVIHNFEEPVSKSVDNYYKDRMTELVLMVDQLRNELKREREQLLFWYLKARGLDKE